MYRNLEAELARRGVRRMDIAKHFDIAPSTVVFRLQGKSDIPLSWAFALKRWLGVEMPLDELFKDDESEDPAVNDVDQGR